MEWDLYLRTVVALLVVLALIAGVAQLAKRFGMLGGASLGNRRKRRLSIVESLPLDNRRRLILVRRDDREHLVLVGGAGGDIVVETNITSAPSLAEPAES